MINKTDFAAKANQRFQKAREFWRNWRTEARDDYAFIAGDQWLQEDESILELQKRPPITFNYSQKMIDAVAGAEVSSRQETRYEPRGVEDAGLSDLWNAAAKWVRDGCNAEDEESDGFKDAMICGMGWTWTRMDYTQDPDGQIVIERIDPLEMFPDPAASKTCLKDRRWQDRVYWADEAAVKLQWPAADSFPNQDDPNVPNPGIRYTGHQYEESEGVEGDSARHEGQVLIRVHECYELEPLYRVASGEEVISISPEDFKKLDSALPGGLPKGSYVKQNKRIYYRAYFAGETLLEVKKSPSQEGFSFQAITGKRDRNKNTFYGLTRVMKDPQRWANKWLSQILHIINSNAKGGLLAEVNAFLNPKDAQEEWSMPESITWLKEGGLNKVQEKQVTQYPSGLDKLMEFALGSLPMVTGINLEALGLANRDQPGVLEQQRKQAAYGLLSPMFDALRQYRKEQGRILLSYIHNYISDGRLVRIAGPESAQFVPLAKQQDAPRYDIIVDQSPNAPDTKERTWNTLIEIIPAMLKAGIPIPPEVLDYTPLPTTLSQKWKQFISQQQQTNQELEQKMQEVEQENQQLKNDQNVKMADLQFQQQQAQQQMELEKAKAAAAIEIQRQKAEADMAIKQWEAGQQMEMEQRRMAHEASMQVQDQKRKKEQSDNDFKLKAFTSGMTDGDMEKKVSFGIDMSGISDAISSANDRSDSNNTAIAQALQQLAKALSSPRKLITDQAGRPIGSALADETPLQ